MAVVFDTIGIQSVGASLVESVETTVNLESVIVKASDSGYGFAEVFDPSYEFTVSGRGDLPSAAVIGAAGDATVVPDNMPSGGITLISSIKLEEKNEDIQSWEITGMLAPGASAAGS